MSVIDHVERQLLTVILGWPVIQNLGSAAKSISGFDIEFQLTLVRN